LEDDKDDDLDFDDNEHDKPSYKSKLSNFESHRGSKIESKRSKNSNEYEADF